MKIRRFNEQVDDVDISSERVGEMVEQLKDLLSILEDKNKLVDELTNELNNFKGQSKKGNDQIDDSIASFQVIRESMSESIDKIDMVINNLVDYNESGRKYLYTETK